MISKFFNLDNSNFSKVVVYLLHCKDIPHGITDIANFTGVCYAKTKVIVKRLYKFGFLKRYCKSGLDKYTFNFNNDVAKKFYDYYGSVVTTVPKRGRK